MKAPSIPAVTAGVFSCAVLALAGGATTARAEAPIVKAINMAFPPFTSTDLCAFPVTIQPTQTGTEQAYFDRNGTPTHTDFHPVEVDTFSANGVTLTGSPFVNQQRWDYDAAGNVIHQYEVGVIERVPLPGGKTFISQGRLDFL